MKKAIIFLLLGCPLLGFSQKIGQLSIKKPLANWHNYGFKGFHVGTENVYLMLASRPVVDSNSLASGYIVASDSIILYALNKKDLSIESLRIDILDSQYIRPSTPNIRTNYNYNSNLFVGQDQYGDKIMLRVWVKDSTKGIYRNEYRIFNKNLEEFSRFTNNYSMSHTSIYKKSGQIISQNYSGLVEMYNMDEGGNILNEYNFGGGLETNLVRYGDTLYGFFRSIMSKFDTCGQLLQQIRCENDWFMRNKWSWSNSYRSAFVGNGSDNSLYYSCAYFYSSGNHDGLIGYGLFKYGLDGRLIYRKNFNSDSTFIFPYNSLMTPLPSDGKMITLGSNSRSLCIVDAKGNIEKIISYQWKDYTGKFEGIYFNDLVYDIRDKSIWLAGAVRKNVSIPYYIEIDGIKIVQYIHYDTITQFILHVDINGVPLHPEPNLIYKDVTSIENTPDLSIQVDIFPNPASNYITITGPDEFEVASYKIFDNAGKLLLSGEIAQNEWIIPVSQLPNGFYHLSLQGKINKYLGHQSFIISR